MKRRLAMILVAVLLTGLFGCGKVDNETPVEGENISTEMVEEETAQDTSEKLTVLTIPASAPFPDGVTINSNEFVDLIQDVTGYELDWQIFKTGEDVGTQLNLLMASGNAPDLIQISGSLDMLYQYASQGGLAELDAAYEANGDYLKEIYTEDVLDTLRYDGKLYGLPRYTGGAPIGTWAIRQDWLDELGLEAPTDREELYQVLKAMKEAHPEATPLLADGLYRLIPILGSFGIYTSSEVDFLIEDGKVTMPMLTERGVEFIKYMNRLYTEGLIDPEFITDDAPLEKMIAGQGGMMFLTYVEIARNMAAFQEKNPDGELKYIDCTVGENGEQGYLGQGLISQIWLVPKTSQDKAAACVDFLNKCNQSKEIVNAVSLGFEGQSYTVEGDEYIPTENASDYTYKGYYSRVIVSSAFDDMNAKMEGYDGYMEEVEQYKHLNDILYAPMGIPSEPDKIAIIKQDITDDVLSMIIDGYSDEAFEAMKAKFVENGGEEIMAEYQAWYDAR